ncbi:hypothetical protein WJX77_008247 [Trebouxia sp. C0004]
MQSCGRPGSNTRAKVPPVAAMSPPLLTCVQLKNLCGDQRNAAFIVYAVSQGETGGATLRVLLVALQWLSKMVHFAPCWNTLGAQEFAQIFVREIFAKHGIPRETISDRELLGLPGAPGQAGCSCG